MYNINININIAKKNLEKSKEIKFSKNNKQGKKRKNLKLKEIGVNLN